MESLKRENGGRKIYSVGIYARLSVEHRLGSYVRKNESVETQIQIAEAWLKEHGDMRLWGCYRDLGRTGTDFERPGFQRLMGDIRAGRVDCVIVKDLSRLGRDYIETGRYLQKVFPGLGVRFISLAENFDSLGEGREGLELPLRNLINDLYARDISMKVQSVRRLQRKRGDYLGARAPYGYRVERGPGGLRYLEPQREAADVVRELFARAGEGRSLAWMASRLWEGQVHTPRDFGRLGHVFRAPGEALGRWSPGTLRALLGNPVYLGFLGGTGEKSHEALVTAEMFRLAQAGTAEAGDSGESGAGLGEGKGTGRGSGPFTSRGLGKRGDGSWPGTPAKGTAPPGQEAAGRGQGRGPAHQRLQAGLRYAGQKTEAAGEKGIAPQGERKTSACEQRKEEQREEERREEKQRKEEQRKEEQRKEEQREEKQRDEERRENRGNRKGQGRQYRVALYMRLSKADEGPAGGGGVLPEPERRESGSIARQRELLREFAVRHLEGCQILEFWDDGYSGTSLERPGVAALLEKARAGELDCILVKDFSRFSRDYIELGDYLNRILPRLGVRFISVTDGYDSGRAEGGSLETCFQSLLGDLYSRDLSAKVKEALGARRAAGEWVSGGVPFGYEREKGDRHRLTVCPAQAQVVREIFAMALAGASSGQIARALNRRGVKTPAGFKGGIRPVKPGQPDAGKALWSPGIVCRILRDPVYTGDMVYGKYERERVGGRNRLKARESWQVFPNQHPALVSREDFAQVQSGKRAGGSMPRKAAFEDGRPGKRVFGGGYLGNKDLGEGPFGGRAPWEEGSRSRRGEALRRAAAYEKSHGQGAGARGGGP